MSKVSGHLETLLKQGNLAILTDYDGTLARFHDDPEQALIPEEMKRAMLMLHCKAGEALAFITGRDMEFMDRAVFFKNRRLPCSSGHGTVFRGEMNGDTLFEEHAVDMTALKTIADTQILPDSLRLEWKRNALAVHYRGPDQQAREFIEGVKQLYNKVIPADAHVDYGQGRLVFELGHEHANKGHAVHRFMALPQFKGKTPVFFGDSPLDNPAFAAVREYDGICVGVGNDVTFDCDEILTNPGHMQSLVHRLAFRF